MYAINHLTKTKILFQKLKTILPDPNFLNSSVLNIEIKPINVQFLRSCSKHKLKKKESSRTVISNSSSLLL